jgi:hypothetical protein
MRCNGVFGCEFSRTCVYGEKERIAHLFPAATEAVDLHVFISRTRYDDRNLFSQFNPEGEP